MSLVSNPRDHQLVNRLLEICSPATPWWRRSFTNSTTSIGRELLESGKQEASVSVQARDALLSAFRDRAMRDPGFGVPAQRNQVKRIIPKEAGSVLEPGHDYALVSSLINQTRNDYLKNWAMEVSGTSPLREDAGDLIIEFLISEGCHPDWIHRWLTYRVRYDVTVYSAADLLEDLRTNQLRNFRSIEILIPLTAEILPRPAPPGWLNSLQVKHWRAKNIPKSTPIRQHGALLLEVEAHDIYASAEMARERAISLAERVRATLGIDVSFTSDMWLSGVSKSLPFLGSPRRVEIKSLRDRAELWSHELPDSLEAAMHLMVPLERGAASAAIIGGWAAVESLLVGAGDRGKYLAAERLGLIVACAFVRSELDSLAWAHSRDSTDVLAQDIKTAGSSRERARTVAAHILTGGTLALKRPEDIRACIKITRFVTNPHDELRNLRGTISQVFEAMYRQRNILAHSGNINSVALRRTASLAAPLVAAGIDRIIDAQLTNGVQPLELVARAEVRANAITSGNINLLVDLLE